MRRGTSAGFSLIDALVSLAILTFGLVALTRFQGQMMAQVTDAQSRSTANRLADELISAALVDPANLACYSLPAAGACGNAAARANTDAWLGRVQSRLPGDPTSSATATAAGTRYTVVIRWTSKDSGEPRQLTANTDVQ